MKAFVVLDGVVDVHHEFAGVVQVEHLAPGRVCIVDEADEHLAHPVGAARILVVGQRETV